MSNCPFCGAALSEGICAPHPMRTVSYPRSGHSLIRDAVLGYFGLSIERNYCEHYTCCRAYPCTDPDKDARVMKSHDLSGAVRPDRWSKLVVGIRRPYECFLSDYRLRVTLAGWENSQRRFCEYISTECATYRQFWAKWVERHADADFRYEYEDFVANFPARFRLLVNLVSPVLSIDEAKLEAVATGIKVRHNLADYEYHHPEAEALVDHLLPRVAEWYARGGPATWVTR